MPGVLVRAKREAVRALPHPLYRLYRRRRVARQIRGYSPHVVTHTYGGRRLHVMLADPLAEGWYDHDWPVPQEVEQLAHMGGLREGALVFNLGAHQGVIALMLAAEVGPAGKIIAVEAEPHNASIALRNVRLNHAANVVVLHAAVADRPGVVSFAEGLNGHVDTGTRLGNVELAAVTIDQLTGEYGTPDVVLLDVEGYEGKALEGAAVTLRARATTFLVEVHATQLVGCSVSALIDSFPSYVLCAAEDDGSEFAPLDGRLPRAARFFLVAAPPAA